MSRLHANVSILSEADVETIHRASLRVLARTGVKVPHPECLKLCAEMGAHVDFESATVRIPTNVIETALAERDPVLPGDFPVELEGRISTQLYLVNHATNTRRPGVLDDVKKGIALVRHLRNITTCNAVVVPSDVPSCLTDIVSHQLLYTYSGKPGGTYVLSPFSAKHILDMAAAMGRTVPFLLDTVSPLQFQANSLEIAMLFARRNQPITIAAMVMAGGTGPVTLAGTLVLENAEVLASLFLVFALTRRVPRYTAIPHSLDLNTMLCSFGSPNQALLGICAAQLARRYGLVAECNSGLTDALRPDFQAGFEKASTAILTALAGVREIGAQGIAGSDQGFSFEQLVLDNEWLEAYNYVVRGFEISEETLAEELIESVGAGGSYLAQEHTGANMRGSYLYSKLFTRHAWEDWRARGCKDALDRAAEFVAAATAGYQNQEPVCTSAQAAALEEIVRCAREEAAA